MFCDYFAEKLVGQNVNLELHGDTCTFLCWRLRVSRLWGSIQGDNKYQVNFGQVFKPKLGQISGNVFQFEILGKFLGKFSGKNFVLLN